MNQMQAEQSLHAFFESASLFLGIVEHSASGIRYVTANRLVSDFLGKEASEVKGKLVTELGFDALVLQEWILRCQQAKAQKRSVRWEFASSRAGSVRVFSCHVSYIGLSDAGLDRFSFASADITEQLEVVRKKEEQAMKFSHLSKMSALGEMASGIAHEIYNPLSIIKGFADLIQKKALSGSLDPEEILQISNEIQATSRRITDIVEGLRFFAREGSADPMELTSLENVISATLKICAERFRKHRVGIAVKHHDKKLTVACREVQISQVILNLLNNAFDSVKDLDEGKVAIETDVDGANIIIRVLDNGYGVPETIRAKIFEPFFTTKPVGIGTGMGLSISRGIMEAHFGSIDLIASSQGACFQLSLPQGQTELNSTWVEP